MFCALLMQRNARCDSKVLHGAVRLYIYLLTAIKQQQTGATRWATICPRDDELYIRKTAKIGSIELGARADQEKITH